MVITILLTNMKPKTLTLCLDGGKVEEMGGEDVEYTKNQ